MRQHALPPILTLAIFAGLASGLPDDGQASILSYDHRITSGEQSFYQDAAVDAEGNVYLVGSIYQGRFEVIVTKLDGIGGADVWEKKQIFGGTGDDFGLGIAIDGLGNVWVTGQTYSDDFPTTAGAAQPTYGGSGDAFVARLDADSGERLYATYLGGIGNDWGMGIAGGAVGEAWVTGYVDVESTGFPATTEFPAGGNGTFVTHLDSQGALVYSVCPNCRFGNAGPQGVRIAVDAFGQAHVTGNTSGDLRGGAYVFKLDADGSESLYQRSWAQSFGSGIALDPSGNVYMTGLTWLRSFPKTPGTVGDTWIGGGDECRGILNSSQCGDAFALKLWVTGEVAWSTLLASEGDDLGLAVDVDEDGNVLVVGMTNGRDFPQQDPVVDGYRGGFSDAFVALLSPDATELRFSSFFGGAEDDGAGLFVPLTMGAALDPLGNAVAVGYTSAGSAQGFAIGLTFIPCEDEDGDGNNDSDGDALCDNWEARGIDVDGDGIPELPLHASPYNADPRHKDLFVEVDYMQAVDHNHRPVEGALQTVEAIFSGAPVTNPDGLPGIELHLMLDEAFPEVEEINFANRVEGPLNDFDDLKLGEPSSPCGFKLEEGHFGSIDDRSATDCRLRLRARRLAFRYLIFAHSEASPTTSGKAELPGNDVVVALGELSMDTRLACGGSQDPRAALSELQASVAMHELGHTLNLQHGGNQNENCKPNYLSVMNYGHLCRHHLPERPLDYSRRQLPTLFEGTNGDGEGGLDEPAGVGGTPDRRTVFGDTDGVLIVRASEPIDWNEDGDTVDLGVEREINSYQKSCYNGIEGLIQASNLTGFDDWQNLLYDFRRSREFTDGVDGRALLDEPIFDEVFEIASKTDSDGDGVSNYPDNCPGIANAEQEDGDGDLTGNACDSCVILANEGQVDRDRDGFGNACDCDFDNDRDCDDDDVALFGADVAAGIDRGIGSDMDANGRVDGDDQALFDAVFANGVPGPSSLVPEPGGAWLALAAAIALATLGGGRRQCAQAPPA